MIHEQIGYLEKIIKLQKEMELIKCDGDNINLIDGKLLLLKNYENNLNDINVEPNEIDRLTCRSLFLKCRNRGISSVG